MTAAGIASMFLCADGLYSEDYIKCNSTDKLKPVYKALEWYDKNFVNALNEGERWPGYFLYGVERVGLASGYKYFGSADWYKLGADMVLGRQNQDGSWGGGGGDIIETAYRVLFLVRGRNPVLFNKLQYTGDWNNRPRDLANACRSLFVPLDGIALNWQIINTKVDVSEWHDAPILVINGSTEPKFTDEELGKLRSFVLQGGMILSSPLKKSGF